MANTPETPKNTGMQNGSFLIIFLLIANAIATLYIIFSSFTYFLKSTFLKHSKFPFFPFGMAKIIFAK